MLIHGHRRLKRLINYCYILCLYVTTPCNIASNSLFVFSLPLSVFISALRSQSLSLLPLSLSLSLSFFFFFFVFFILSLSFPLSSSLLLSIYFETNVIPYIYPYLLWEDNNSVISSKRSDLPIHENQNLILRLCSKQC